MSYTDIERTISEFGDKVTDRRFWRADEHAWACFPFQAKKGALSIEDMDGGTFTISNGGVFGSLFGTPIINPPQSAILGMHGIFDRPVAINGKVSRACRSLSRLRSMLVSLDRNPSDDVRGPDLRSSHLGRARRRSISSQNQAERRRFACHLSRLIKGSDTASPSLLT